MAINFLNNQAITGDLSVGSNTNGYDVTFFGDASGEFMQWDASAACLTIRHTDEEPGLGIFTNGGAITSYPQLRVGRDNGQYWGVYTGDRDAHLVHRQDETTGVMTTRFDQWDNNTGDDTGLWLWRSGNASGASMLTALTLTQAGSATFAGNLIVQGTGDSSFVGNVGIGTPTPSQKLDVNGNTIVRGDIVSRDTYPSIYVDHSGTAMGGIRADATNKLELKTLTTAPLSFQVNSSEKMRILDNGNVGIGTTNPSSQLNVHKNALSPAIIELSNTVTSGNDGVIVAQIKANTINEELTRIETQNSSNSHDNGNLLFYNRNGYTNTFAESMRITGEGDVGIGVTGPNAKLEVSYTNTGIGAIVGNTTHNSQLQIYTAAAGKNSEIWFGDSADDNVGKIDYDHPIDAMLFTTNATEKMRITSGGNVGIGTTSPQSKLHIADSTLSLLKVQETSGNTGASAGALFKTSPNTGNSYFKGGILYEDTGNANVIGKLHLVNRVSADTTNADVGDAKLTIDTVGNVGIGTTSPTTKLHIVGIAQIVESGNTAFYGGDYVRMFGTQSYRFRNTSGTTVAQISLTGNSYFNGGNVGIGTTAPSQKLHVAGNMRLQNQLYDSTNSIGFNGQVLTKTSAGTIWADNRGSTPTTPGGIVATIVGETIEIAFNQSTTSNIDYYQVWSSDDAGDYGIIGQIAPADFSSTMTVVDTTFVTGGTMSYRVYAVKSGVYSTAGTVSKAYTVSALSVTDMTVVNLNTAYYIQYEKPTSRFIDHVEIYMDSQTTSAALSRSNATIVYSGQNASYMRNVNTSSNFHQFWVEIVTS